MKSLNIDLELLTQSFSFNEFEFGKEYLDKTTGNIINIPVEVKKVVEGKQEKTMLSSWELELLDDAYSIYQEDERYLSIPTVPDKYIFSIMVEFMDEVVESEVLRVRLNKALNSGNSIASFKSVLFEHQDLLESWYLYEEEKLKLFAIQWLEENGILLEA